VRPAREPFEFPGRSWREPVSCAAGELLREQHTVTGTVDVSAQLETAGLYRVAVEVRNTTEMPPRPDPGRDDAALWSLASAHTILHVRGGAFVSQTDPPKACRTAAAACRNVGVWPVMVGEHGATDTVLAAPIILPDYPQVAPESPGDCFGVAEIDKMLTPRIRTLTDDETRAMDSVDKQACALLARARSMAADQLKNPHGVIQGTA
jgi:hypothetical protein